MKKDAVAKKTERKYGEFFEEITGKRIAECRGILEMEAAIEKNLGRKLEYSYFNSTVIPRRGNVFPHSKNDLQGVDAEIDSLLNAKN